MCVANQRCSRCRRKTSARHGETGPTPPLLPNSTRKARLFRVQILSKFEYTMIGDPTLAISRNFEVLIEEAGLADRGTFVIDPNGKIQVVEITAGGIGRDAQELLRKVKAAQYVAAHPGEVCPAKWQEGEKTLAPSL